MANAMYDNGKAGLLGGSPATIDWNTDDIRQICIDEADDTIDLTNDDFLNDRAAPSRVATSGALTITVTAGVVDITDHTHSTVTGDQFESLDYYKHTGNEATALMLVNIDTATGLPCTPNGADINIVYDNGANKFFSI